LFFHGRRLLFHQTEFSRFGQFSSRVWCHTVIRCWIWLVSMG
jgi:hypothetical protein